MTASKKGRPLDLSNFPPGSISEYSTLVCLACCFDIFTNSLGLAPRTAYSEIKRYSPSIEELTAPKTARPFFDSEENKPHCPYCEAAKRWHARFDTVRIEGSRASDAARRELIKTLPKKEEFQTVETKSDRRTVFFDWLDTLGRSLNLDDDAWLGEATQAFLQRSEPKTNWSEVFKGVRAIRRSNRLDKGWERDGSRLFLAPVLYSEALLVQYLISRSHKHGGRTLDGRLTLHELTRRLRQSGYLDRAAQDTTDQFELLEKLVEKLAGGSGRVTLYYIVDRRDFLEKVKTVYERYAAA
jgi:hypothetical protein